MVKDLILDQPIDKELKLVKDSDGNKTALELSKDTVRVNNLEVSGTTTGISASDNTKLPLSGGTLTGNLDMGDQRIVDAQRVGFNDGGFITELIDNDDMSNATNTKVSSSESIKAYVDAQDKPIRDIKASGFNYSSTAPTRVFIPLGATTGEFSSLSGANEFRSFVVPYDGYLEQIIVRSEDACGTTTMGLHTSASGTEIPNNNSQANVAVNMSAQDTAFKFDFVNNAQPGSDNTFSAGEIIAISFTPQFDSNDTNATIILVYDGVNGV